MKIILLAALALFSVGCSNMTPEQQTQWSATTNVVTQQAADIALDEARARLKATRKTSDNK